MSLNVDLLRSSFDLVLERQPALTERFYEILFARYPQVVPLFSPSRRAAQSQMLAGALTAVLDHLEDASWLGETLRAMGKKHLDYGVTDQMYGWVGESLLAAIEEAAGPDWSRELELAWSDAYGAISGLMLGGAHEGAQVKAAV